MLSTRPAPHVAVALTFSSTIIIVKLLSDKREIDSLHGCIAMGFLIVQDIAVVLAMMVIGTQGAVGDDTSLPARLDEILAKVVALGAVVAILIRWVLPRVLQRVSASQELLLVFAVAWGTALAAGGEWLGVSKEVGAFVAGYSLASLPFREAINARLASLRDFLLLFFFVNLGTQLDISSLGAEIPAVAIGHVDPAALGLVTLVGLVTITMSTYMILYSQQIYEFCEPWLGVFERRRPWREQDGDEPPDHADVIVFGMGRYGRWL